MNPKKKSDFFVQHLFSWYEQEKRDLPWRNTHDPYYIWVSEIMLQQTQVSRVISYYARFLERFPTVQDLALASWEELLPYWNGLGFYRRGKNMLRAAQMIVSEYGGVFPPKESELKKLPGIGEYTAGAIMSFAFQKPIPAVDTNFIRVFQRYFSCTEKDISSRAREIFLQTSQRKAALLNHAIMDLGSSFCMSRKTDCYSCPLQKHCSFFVAHGSGTIARPQKKSSSPKKSSKKMMEVAAACIHHEGKYLIAQRIPEKGGEWEFVGGKREKGEDWRHAVKREVEEEVGILVSVRPHFFEEIWEDQEYCWRLRFFRCQILRGEVEIREHADLHWVLPEELSNYNFPEANARAVQKLQKMRIR